MKIKILSILALLLTMVQGAWAQDELGGEFSVSAVKKVHFSRGNLRATTRDLCRASVGLCRQCRFQYQHQRQRNRIHKRHRGPLRI